ncbi:phosphatidylinositol-4-phosphate 5-kinase family protein [Heterostelium album PN500]|uniref:Phosphatidylinositol-4-phosphate 5-kinase family protein n=1 Tax=Heterostelium pallidum (strain ATCC 26659 / Pp 5 / PN500) TaxID=670386 RepID=D3AZJ1_HETP5|nr:phosphatidylinositol-4-phosphate 5-kinase family protein [Heterostelium album PN500]EFA85370.1 phosphatidylinositol-4-phosphate 5-kinase family protein [Heterostelium album PN500]|eukprot:XP_020437479.1 phosphatidylinositol-4-phosphate 5-kinase family protein [Heterostelium album PN500]
MLQFNRFKTKIRNAPLFGKNGASPPSSGGAGGIIKAITKRLFNERKVIVVGEEGSFIASLLTSVLAQFECSVTYLSLIVHTTTSTSTSTTTPDNIDNNNNNNNNNNNEDNNNNNNINTLTINMSKCWVRSGPNMCATVDQEELSRVMNSIVNTMDAGDFVILCCEWAEYRQLFDQLDVLARCCKSASVRSVAVVFPMGVEDESITQLSSSSSLNSSSTCSSNGKSIESIFEGITTTFLFYSALMQWLFIGPPNNSDRVVELSNVVNSNSIDDGGCYWLDCDDLIKVIVEIVRQSLELVSTNNNNNNESNSSSSSSSSSNSISLDNRMYIITGGECLSGKDIAMVLNNELHMTTQDYKGDRGDTIAKFYQYLKSPISTIQSPDIEVFLNHQPTTFSEFISKCQATQIFNSKSIEIVKRKLSLTNSLNNSNNNISNSSNSSHDMTNSLTSSTSSVSSSSSSNTSDKNNVLGSPPSPLINNCNNNNNNSSTTTTTTTTSTTTQSSITSSAIKIVSSPFSFLKYSKALIEETIYKTPAASKKKDSKDRETDTWISLLTTGFKKMLDSQNSIDDQPITDLDYQKESTYEFLDDIQSNWTLTSYAPKIFDNIRKFYLIDHFLVGYSYQQTPIGLIDKQSNNSNNNGILDFEQVKTIGRSGSFFFQSNDGRYFLKTLPSNEFMTFSKILPSYYQHIQKYSNNLLPRFYGLYRLKGRLHINNNNNNNSNSNNNGCGDNGSTGSNSGSATNLDSSNSSNTSNASSTTSSRDVIFIIMENLFYCNPTVELHERYDLKGSTVGRFVDVDELDDLSLHTLKDLNLKRKLYIGPYKKLLVAQLEVDTEWLLNHSICDYSLLVGIHLGSSGGGSGSGSSASNTNTTDKEKQLQLLTKDISFFKKDSNGILSSTMKPMHVIPIRNGRTAVPPILSRQDSVNQVRFSAMSVENELHNADSEQSDDSSMSEHEEDESLRFEEGTIYYIGLIDTLTTYDMKKRGEHAIKSVLFDKTQISAVSPKDYRTRFIKYIQTIVE